jgi:hypothetical protein
VKDVIAAEAVDSHRLILTFEGGEQREIDLAAIIPFQGVFAPLRDETYFRRVQVNSDIGTIVWPNGADICPDVLYERSTPLGQTSLGALQR